MDVNNSEEKKSLLSESYEGERSDERGGSLDEYKSFMSIIVIVYYYYYYVLLFYVC